jgi:dephospho-CoA kinase
MKVIGLTGGIACGKSSVGDILRKLGVKVIDADEIAHQIYRPGTPSHAELVKVFGPDILDADGRINRQRLGKIAFQNQEARSRLEQITHPAIIQRIDDLINAAKIENHPLLVVEVPLLFEAGLEEHFDCIWVVSARPDIQLKRLMKRNDLTPEEAAARLSAQLPLDFKEGRADVIIYNNNELIHLEEEIKRLLETVNFSPLS